MPSLWGLDPKEIGDITRSNAVVLDAIGGYRSDMARARLNNRKGDLIDIDYNGQKFQVTREQLPAMFGQLSQHEHRNKTMRVRFPGMGEIDVPLSQAAQIRNSLIHESQGQQRLGIDAQRAADYRRSVESGIDRNEAAMTTERLKQGEIALKYPGTEADSLNKQMRAGTFAGASQAERLDIMGGSKPGSDYRKSLDPNSAEFQLKLKNNFAIDQADLFDPDTPAEAKPMIIQRMNDTMNQISGPKVFVYMDGDTPKGIQLPLGLTNSSMQKLLIRFPGAAPEALIQHYVSKTQGAR